MAYFTKEQIEQAKRLDLLSYLQNYNPEELVYESRNSYTTRTHDSLKISNGMWYWFSRGIGGKSALEYLIQVEEYSFLFQFFYTHIFRIVHTAPPNSHHIVIPMSEIHFFIQSPNITWSIITNNLPIGKYCI